MASFQLVHQHDFHLNFYEIGHTMDGLVECIQVTGFLKAPVRLGRGGRKGYDLSQMHYGMEIWFVNILCTE